jgi:phytoene synthase
MTLAAPQTGAVDPSEAEGAAQAASGSSFYAGMRVQPKAEREAMYAVYGFCRIVDDIADDQTRPIPQQKLELDAWRADIESLYASGAPGRAALLAGPVARYSLEKADLLAVVAGMEMDLVGIRAPDQATLDLYIDRVACAVGRLSVKIFGMPAGPGLDLAHHLGRALQLTNILRDLDEDAAMGRLYLPVERLEAAGVTSREPRQAIAAPGVEIVCRDLAEQATDHYAAARRILAARPSGRLAAPRLMGAAYGAVLKRMCAQGWAAPRKRVKLSKGELVWMLIRCGLLGASG